MSGRFTDSEKEDNTMKEKYSDERRTFLKTVILLGGAAASLSLTKSAQADGIPPRLLPDASTQGYRETAHICRYYETARN
jgi:hypothetical protein